jgi:hypothetical protein
MVLQGLSIRGNTIIKIESGTMNKRAPQCKHERVDRYGICAECGTLTSPLPYHLYITASLLLDAEKETGTISDADYLERKAKLDFVKEYSMIHNIWRPYSMDVE